MSPRDKIRDELREEILLALESLAAERLRSGHIDTASALAQTANYYWALERTAEIIQRRFSVRRKGGAA